jgi:hypothetical protein
MKTLLIDNNQLSTIILPDDSDFKRDRARPKEFRHPAYDQEYDFQTVLYDAFVSHDESEIIIPAPSFLNFDDVINPAAIAPFAPQGTIQKFSKKNWPNYSEVILGADCEAIAKKESQPFLQLDLSDNHNFSIAVQKNHSDFFQNKRVVIAMLKFDYPEWIKGWMEFYVRYHKADAFLIYNNASPFIDSQNIIDLANSIIGVDAIAVVDWPFLYGPQAEGSGCWDSVFTKAGFFEHSKQRFLMRAKSVLNVDIDELVVMDNDFSVFEIVESFEDQYLLFHGIWASAPENISPQPENRRHSHYKYHGRIDADTKQCPSKWAVVPEKCPKNAQWTTHDIQGMNYVTYPNEQIRYRHFRNLNIGWKDDRTKPLLEYNEDALLVAAYKKIGWL